MPPYVVRCKQGVVMPSAPAGIRITAAVDKLPQILQRDVTVTSGAEGRGRLATDPHMTGEALDLSVAGLTAGEVIKLKRELEATLGPLFTVLYEVPRPPLDTALAAVAYINSKATGPHVHIQRKKGTVYPPPLTGGMRV